MKKDKSEIQAEVAKIIHPLRRSTVAVSMGVGKTLIGLQHMNSNYTDYAKFLVVAPKRSILDEWVNEIHKHGLMHLLPHITFSTYLSLHKQSRDFDCIYLDEIQSIKFKHSEYLSKYKGKILGLTGTAPSNKHSEKFKMIDVYCPVVYTYKTDDAVIDEILNDYRIVVHSLSLDSAKTLKVEKNGKVWFTSEKATYDYWTGRVDSAVGKKEQQIMSVMRMRALMEFPSKDKLAKKLLDSSINKIILFTNTQKQADSFGIPSYHSKNPKSEENLEKFKRYGIQKLAAVQQLSEGVNITGLKEAIIMHSFSGNSPKSQQKLGRCLRLSIDQVATINILMYENTIDEYWVKSCLKPFDQTKITTINH